MNINFWEESWFLALVFTTSGLTWLYILQVISAYRLKKKLSQERTELYNMIVHDLGPALNRSQGDLKMLRNTLSIERSESKDLLNSLDADNQYSLSFINQLRSLSTVEGFYEKQKDLFLLEDIVDESVNSFRTYKDRIKVKVITDCTVLAYENSLEFIIKNLISNALKYSKSDTFVTIELKQINENAIMISVADQGAGISEAFKKSVFKPYKRDDYYKTEGLGIGLTLIKSITQKYRGDIAIMNNYPQGTIMQVILRNIIVAER